MSKMFIVKPEDVGEDELKCGGCGWRVSRLYVLAGSKKEAVDLVKEGLAGLCGDCMCDLLANEGYSISKHNS